MRASPSSQPHRDYKRSSLSLLCREETSAEHRTGQHAPGGGTASTAVRRACRSRTPGTPVVKVGARIKREAARGDDGQSNNVGACPEKDARIAQLSCCCPGARGGIRAPGPPIGCLRVAPRPRRRSRSASGAPAEWPAVRDQKMRTPSRGSPPCQQQQQQPKRQETKGEPQRRAAAASFCIFL